RRDELADGLAVPRHHVAHRGLGRGIPVEREARAADQEVRDPAQGGDHDDRLLVQALADAVRDGPDALGGAHGGPAELHDDHGNSPRTRRSSAFRMAAPAAPRIVLWTRASSFRSKTRSPRTRPTETAMPPSRSRSSRGCGRSGASRTWIGRRGAEGSSRSCGSPENEASTRTASAALAFRARRRKIAIVWPSTTGTRCTEAEMGKGAGWNAPSTKRPRIFCGSLSVFSSSPPPM